MAEIDVNKTEPEDNKTSTANLDITEIIGKVRDLVGNIQEISRGEPMSVTVEGFNVSVSKEHGEYEFALKLNLVLKPKAIVKESST